MYRNQYLALNYELGESNDLNKTYFGDLVFYSHPSLNITVSKKNNAEVLLLGYIINPLYPKEQNEKIIGNLAENCHTKEKFFREVQSLSGRFVLFFKTINDFIVLNDACSMRSIYYCFEKNKILLTSSQKMFMDFYGKELIISDLKKYFINIMQHYENDYEFSWYGDDGIDDRLLKVLPNHYLDLNKKRVIRSQIYYELLASEKDALDYSSAILRGNMHAITNRYEVIQPITAGWDSRTCLAAAQEFTDKIQLFIFDKSDGREIPPDIWVPKNLCRKLGLNFKVIDLDVLDDDFLILYKQEHVIPRLCKAKEIQYFYKHFINKNVVRVSGHAGDIIKGAYGYTKSEINEDILYCLAPYPVKICNYIKEKLRQWLDDTKEFSEISGIPLLDLFYWEQRIGNWGSLYAFEQDIAIEEFSPHSNKNLLLSLLRIHPKYRVEPKCVFITKLIKNLWPETLTEPINPDGLWGRTKVNIRKHAMLRYYKRKYFF